MAEHLCNLVYHQRPNPASSVPPLASRLVGRCHELEVICQIRKFWLVKHNRGRVMVSL
jgi:hypothetical protein